MSCQEKRVTFIFLRCFNKKRYQIKAICFKSESFEKLLEIKCQIKKQILNNPLSNLALITRPHNSIKIANLGLNAYVKNVYFEDFHLLQSLEQLWSGLAFFSQLSSPPPIRKPIVR